MSLYACDHRFYHEHHHTEEASSLIGRDSGCFRLTLVVDFK